MEKSSVPHPAPWNLRVVHSAEKALIMKVSGSVKTQDTWAFCRDLYRKSLRLRQRDLVFELSELDYASAEVLQYLAANYRPKNQKILHVTLVNTPPPTAEKIRQMGRLPYLRFSESIQDVLLGSLP